MKSKFSLIILVSIVCGLFGCFHIELMHSGIIRDADTKKPLKDAIVFIDLCHYCTLPPNLGGASCEPTGSIETLTDDNGKYRLPIQIFLLPPLMCVTDEPNAYYIKAGYFRKSSAIEKDVKLCRMNHYLNYLPIIEDKRFVFSGDVENKSELVKKIGFDKLKLLKPEPADEIGVFFRSPGRKLTRIYASPISSYYDEKYPDHMIYSAYDDHAKEWITIDGRGKHVEVGKKEILPEFDYLSLDREHRPVFASSSEIFNIVNNDVDLIPTGFLDNFPGKINYIKPHIGNITAIAGYVYDEFYTIENNGSLLCKYGHEITKIYNEMGRVNPVPRFKSSVNAEDLPTSRDDNSTRQGIFKFISYMSFGVLDIGLFVITETPEMWHVYNIRSAYDQEYKGYKSVMTEIISFPRDKEITAFTMGVGNENHVFRIFLAFKDEGIRSFTINMSSNYTKWQITEDIKFYKNAGIMNKMDIQSLAYGNSIDSYAIYAVTGDDKIYRFSTEGIPDFIIKPVTE